MGVVVGLVVGKLLGVFGSSALPGVRGSASTATSSAASASRHRDPSSRCATCSGTNSATCGATPRSCRSTPTRSQGRKHPRPRRPRAGSSTSRAIFDDQDNQRPSDIIRIAHDLGLDVEQFEKDLISAEVTGRVRDDLLDAEAMNITAVPTLFINGRRHVGPYDAQSLLRALTVPTDTPVAE
jgi:hypothetical protein